MREGYDSGVTPCVPEVAMRMGGSNSRLSMFLQSYISNLAIATPISLLHRTREAHLTVRATIIFKLAIV